MGNFNCKNCKCQKEENDDNINELKTEYKDKKDNKTMENDNNNAELKNDNNKQKKNTIENPKRNNNNINLDDNIITDGNINMDINNDSLNPSMLKNSNLIIQNNKISNSDKMIFDDNSLGINITDPRESKKTLKDNIKISNLSINNSSINKSRTTLNNSKGKLIYNKKSFNKSNINKTNKEVNKSFFDDESFQKNIKEFDIENLNFGISEEEKENLSPNEQKLLEEAQKILKDFYPIDETEIKHLHNELSKISLINILPHDQKNILDSNEYIYHSDLKKLINIKVKIHSQTYSDKFCVLTSKAFIYYKNKEQLLRKLKPLSIIPLENITRINLVKNKKESNKLNHIIICNKGGILRKKNNSVFGSFSKNVENNNLIGENTESILIFMDDNENLILKWYMVLQYVLTKFKERKEDKI